MHRDAKSAIATLICSIGRRLALGAVITFGEGDPLMQFLFIHFSSLTLIALLGALRPLETRSSHRIELGSEFFILVLFSNILCHTGLVWDQDARYITSWSLIGITSVGMIFGFGNLLRISIVAIIQRIKMCTLKAALKKKQLLSL